jgi:hypothetical protein
MIQESPCIYFGWTCFGEPICLLKHELRCEPDDDHDEFCSDFERE